LILLAFGHRSSVAFQLRRGLTEKPRRAPEKRTNPAD